MWLRDGAVGRGILQPMFRWNSSPTLRASSTYQAPARRELGLLAGIVVVAAVVRLATLDLQSFDHDEAVTAGRVLLPNLFDTLHVVANSERSPPLYYLLAWVWSRPFGTGEVGLRSLSALFGILTVLAAWLAGRRLASPRVGLIAAALVALNPYLIWYSQQARSYALMVLLTSVSLACMAAALREPARRWLWLWALASAAALCSHYFALFVVVPEAVWIACKLGPANPRVLKALGAVVLTAVALAPLAHHQEDPGRRNAFTEIPVIDRSAETLLNFVASEEPNAFVGPTRVDLVQGGAALAGMGALASPRSCSSAAGVGRSGTRRHWPPRSGRQRSPRRSRSRSAASTSSTRVT